ncbi:MC048L [Molluscum contagiosum virus subtype 1]|mgnify:FL=1|uniref:MC048L n=3 Tax=Molluscum contagiosum virus TaxID=10279 RepID=A0A7G5AX48_MCV1|nr:MC048L [Molluscum contagiosum virus subtype 1]AZT86242.1 MC048L [Molluscum contagiosum virus]AAC55176.1 MC048L [Molluscum contagiosum virus subtype 1]AQY16795.1 MC048 [Molluscum contagiosum virus subtype 1]AQY16975.1 MC048 [Molluscum contagiosum virus subtype 1]AQY17155.1 MC048 [Molluscum contagiosum virus subtype 1]
MNHFVKQVAARARKPARELERVEGDVPYARVLLRFDFSALHYNHGALFCKRENTLEDVDKSLLVLAAFRYEAYVLRTLVRTLTERGRAHVYDIYFLPVGWLAGVAADVPPAHAALRLLHSGRLDALERRARELLAQHDVLGVELEDEGPCSVPRFALPAAHDAPAPVAVLAFYPFDPGLLLAVVFFGRHGDAHCGLAYTAPRAQLPALAAALHAHVADLYLLHDEVGHFSSTRVHNNAPLRFPAETCAGLCEVTRAFAHERFAAARALVAHVPPPFVPKQLVSIVDLPCDTELTCASVHGIDFVTHISGRRLHTVLLLAKEGFMADTVFAGVFSKRNMVWRGRYTFRVLRASFPCPELRGAGSASGADGEDTGTAHAAGRRALRAACHKHCFRGSRYTTRTPAHVV